MFFPMAYRNTDSGDCELQTEARCKEATTRDHVMSQVYTTPHSTTDTCTQSPLRPK